MAGGPSEKGDRIEEYNRQVQDSHGDVKFSVWNVVPSVITRCGARRELGVLEKTLCNVRDRLTAKLHTQK